MREMVRRSKPDHGKISYVLHLLNQAKHVDQPEDPQETEALSNLGELGELIYLYEETGFLTVAIIEYINDIVDILQLSQWHREHLERVLIKLVQQPSFDMYVVHDNFKCHVNYVNYTRYWYNDILANIVESNLLNFLLKQVTPQHIQFPVNWVERKIIAEKVRNSNYAIC